MPFSGVWHSPKSELLSAAATQESVEYAGFWSRFAAMCLDGIVVLIAWMGTTIVFGIAAALIGDAGMPYDMPVLLFLVYPALLLAIAAYYVLMESSERGATFGKRVFKLRVVDLAGNRISKGRAIGRFLAHFLSPMTVCLGYLIQPVTGKKQALHDMVSGTLVLKTNKDSHALAMMIVMLMLFFGTLAGFVILESTAVPAYLDYLTRTNVLQADAVGKAATRAVENYAAQTGKMPASLADTGVQLPQAPEAASVTVNPQTGQVRVVIGKGMPPTVAGKALVFDRLRAADGIVWTCSGPGMPAEMLPPDCK